MTGEINYHPPEELLAEMRRLTNESGYNLTFHAAFDVAGAFHRYKVMLPWDDVDYVVVGANNMDDLVARMKGVTPRGVQYIAQTAEDDEEARNER